MTKQDKLKKIAKTFGVIGSCFCAVVSVFILIFVIRGNPTLYIFPLLLYITAAIVIGACSADSGASKEKMFVFAAASYACSILLILLLVPAVVATIAYINWEDEEPVKKEIIIEENK